MPATIAEISACEQPISAAASCCDHRFQDSHAAKRSCTDITPATITEVVTVCNTNVVRRAATITSVVAPSAPSLASRRYQALVRQLSDEMSQRAVSTRLGLSGQGAVSMYLKGERYAKLDKIERAVERLGLDRSFFDDPSLGDEPDYHRFLRSNLERAAAYPEIDAYLAEMDRAGTPVAPEHVSKLRAWRRALGPVEREEIVGYHRGMIAADARKALERPLDERARLDVDRGQRPLLKTRRRSRGEG